MHSLQIEGALYQFAFSGCLPEASEQELPEPHNTFDDAKNRFYRRFSSCVKFPDFLGLQPPLHRLDRRRILRGRAGIGQSLLPAGMVFLARRGNIGRCLPLGDKMGIIFAKIAGFSSYWLYASKLLRKLFELVYHGFELLFVVCLLRRDSSKNPMGVDIYTALQVISLLPSVGTGEHNSGVRVRKVDLISLAAAGFLKKNEIKPWKKKGWIIPPKQNSDFIAAMERVLEVYKRPYDRRFPVVCMDESPKQLIGESQK